MEPENARVDLLRRVGVAALAFVVVTLLAGLSAIAPAFATDGHIDVRVTKLVKTDKLGEGEKDETLHIWDTAKLAATWDASSLGRIDEGTSFFIDLPEIFAFRDQARTDDLTVRDDSGTTHTIGTCVTDKTRMECTFNATAAALADKGFKNFRGTATMLLTVLKSHDASTVDFDLNGSTVPVDLPGPEGIPPLPYAPWSLHKWTEDPLQKGQTKNRWALAWGNDFLRDSMKPEGSFKTDGGVSTLVLHDVLGEGQEYDPSRPAEAQLILNQSAADPNQRLILRDLNGATDSAGLWWDFSIVEKEKNTLEITVKGPFAADTNMNVIIPVRFTTPAGPGVVHTNTLTAKGIDKKVTAEAQYVESVNVTAVMERGFGTFTVETTLTGTGAAHVDPKTSFDVVVDFELPKTFDAGQAQWKAPKGFTMSSDGLCGHGTITVHPGKTTVFDEKVTLPAGTKVKLSADPASVQPVPPASLKWGSATFTPAEFVIQDQKVTAVKLVNTVEKTAPAVSVGDYVWEDTDGDGLQGDPTVEKPISGVVLAISRSDSKPVTTADGKEMADRTTKTNDSGKYLFSGLAVLPAGVHYVVTIQADTIPAGLTPTVENDSDDSALDSSAVGGKAESVDLTNDGDKDLTLDFGFHRGKPLIDIEKYDGDWSGVVFADGTPKLENGQPANLPEGDRDVPEKALVVANNVEQKVSFTVTNTGKEDLHKVVVTDLTKEGPALSGIVCEVGGRTYEAADGRVTLDPAWVFPAGSSFTCVGMMPALGSDPAYTGTATVHAESVHTSVAVTDSDSWHARVLPKVSVGDFVWLDEDGDGVQDAGEPGLSDVTMTLAGPDGKPVTDVLGVPVEPVKTDAQGMYVFDNLPVLLLGQSYTVHMNLPEGYEATKAGVGSRNVDSSTDKAVSEGLTRGGDSDMTLDFGVVRKVTTPVFISTLPTTGSTTGLLLVGAGIALAAGAGALVLRNRRG